MEEKILENSATEQIAENEEIMVKIENVSKRYRLGVIGGTTLRDDIKRWWAKLRKKEDPTKKIGAKDYKKGDTFMALTDVSFEVKKGEAIGLIGHNGAGKSTLLKLITRVTAPTSGKIYLNGRVASMLEVGTGFHGELTGRENIYMNGAILGMTKKEIDEKIEDIIDFSEVREFIDTPVKRYSSGMFVKLAFSVAAHLNAEILLMDEVLAVGDMAFQRKCINKMREVANSGKTIIYVSHNMNTIRQLCDKCVVLDKGTVVFEGDVEDAVTCYMGNKEVSQNHIKTKDVERSQEFKNDLIKITEFNVETQNDGIFITDEIVDGNILIESKIDVKTAYIRFIVKTSEGIPVTMSNSLSSISLNQGTNNIDFIFDLSNIVPGSYNLSIVLYEVDEVGCDVNLDGLHKIFNFQIKNDIEYNKNMGWKAQYWGYMRCKDLQISKSEK